MSKQSKGNKKKKKDKSGSASSSKKGIGAKLESYWKGGRYGEYLTLYQRHWQKAKETDAARYFQAAVYNSLLQALFEHRDFSLLSSLLNTIGKTREELSEDNRACVQIARVAYNLEYSKADHSQMRNLPLVSSGPFRRLRDHLANLPERTKESSGLREYLQGTRERAKKGEKPYALAGRMQKQFKSLLDQEFAPSSVTPFTQLKKTVEELEQLLAGQGEGKWVLRDAAILADLMRSMYKDPWLYAREEQLILFLQQNRFKFNNHTLILDMLNGVFKIGRYYYGGDWEQRMRISLSSFWPQLLQGLPEYAQKQIVVQNSLKNRPSDENESELSNSLKAMLRTDQDIWTQRERYVLVISWLKHMAQNSDKLMNNLMRFFLDEKVAGEAARELENQAVQATDCLLEVFRMHRQLGLTGTAALENCQQLWERCVDLAPLDISKQKWHELCEQMLAQPLTSARYLYLLYKGAEEELQFLNALKEHIYQSRGLLKLSQEDIHSLKDLLLKSNPEQTLQKWRGCLEQPDLTALSESILLELYKESLEHEPDPFLDDGPIWFNISRELMRELSLQVSEEFPLRGLLELTFRSSPDSYPMPGNEQQAQIFLQYFTPEPYLYEILLWMFDWPKSSYSNTFFESVIWRLSDYATRNELWSDLAEKVSLMEDKDLARRIWDIWSVNGLMESLRDSEDFQVAYEQLRPLAYKARSKKSGKKSPKQKSLLQETLEERRNNKKGE